MYGGKIHLALNPLRSHAQKQAIRTQYYAIGVRHGHISVKQSMLELRKLFPEFNFCHFCEEIVKRR